MPLAGLNTREPFIGFESGYARELTNYSIQNGSIQMRPGVAYTAAHASITNRILWYASGSPAEVISGGNRVNFSTGAVLGALASYAFNAIPIAVKHQSLEYIIGLGAPRASTSPFGVWGFTTLAITATAITSACSHKGRLYVCDGSTIEYSDIGQITGAIPAGQSFPISRFMQGETVLRMFSITALPGNYTSNVFVIFGSGGRVLVYEGDYPGSPSWQLIGDFKMPAPISAVCLVAINGDIFVATDQYCYWFRDLFTADAQIAYEKRPSKPIDNLWQSVVWTWSSLSNPEISHVWYNQALNAIICQCFEKGELVKVGEYQNEACYFVYFLEYKAWAFWLMAPMFAPIISNALGMSYGPPWGITSLNASAGFDENQITGSPAWYEIYTSWKTPYYQPTNGRNKQLSGVKPFYYHEFSGDLELIQAIYEMSDYTQPFGFYNQPSAIGGTNPLYFTSGNISLPSTLVDIYTEFCGVSGNGAGVSIQFTQKGEFGVREPQKIYAASMTLTEGANYPA
jgi:hypothetical protein